MYERNPVSHVLRDTCRIELERMKLMYVEQVIVGLLFCGFDQGCSRRMKQLVVKSPDHSVWLPAEECHSKLLNSSRNVRPSVERLIVIVANYFIAEEFVRLSFNIDCN